jgi:hypothetical protein
MNMKVNIIHITIHIIHISHGEGNQVEQRGNNCTTFDLHSALLEVHCKDKMPKI